MKSIVAMLFLLISFIANAEVWEEDNALAMNFKNMDVIGTFVLYDVTQNTFHIHNLARAESRFFPASTFKIPHSLIGLSSGAIKSLDDVLPYKGEPVPLILDWAKDMSLKEAFKLSNVRIFQELARRIGINQMQDNVSLLHYGNMQIGTSVDRFWLSGPLTINAVEQARFLAQLAQDKLPYSREIQKQVREMAFLEAGDNWRLYGKTGWADTPDQKVGWWVGWVVQNERLYTFAMNMEMNDISEANKRITLGKACLRTLGLL